MHPVVHMHSETTSMNPFAKDGYLLIRIAYVIYLLLLISGCGGGGGDSGPAGGGTVRGTVIDTNTQFGIPGAQVVAGDQSVNTAKDGEYLLTLNPGEYVLRVEALGFEPLEIDGINVLSGSSQEIDALLVSNGTNVPPEQPTLNAPADESAGISYYPKLEAFSFIDQDPDQIHQESRWQVADDASFDSVSIVIEIDSRDLLTALRIEWVLEAETTYYWRVRFLDDFNRSSPWSEVYSFTTADDADQDGMPDIWELSSGLDPQVDDASEDPDQDGFSNLEEYYLSENPNSVTTDDDGSLMGFLEGHISDADSGAHLRATLETSGGVVARSDENGFYFLVHDNGNADLRISQSGYQDRTLVDVIIPAGGTNTLDIEMVSLSQKTQKPEDGNGNGCFIVGLIYR